MAHAFCSAVQADALRPGKHFQPPRRANLNADIDITAVRKSPRAAFSCFLSGDLPSHAAKTPAANTIQ